MQMTPGGTAKGFRVNLENTLRVANLTLLAVTLLGVLLSGLVYALSQANDKQKDRELVAYKAKAEQEISRANQAAEEARLKAAEATLQLEREREAREKLTRDLGPRRLTPKAKAELSQALKVSPPYSVAMMVQPEPEVVAYAKDFAEVFEAAGVQHKLTVMRIMSAGTSSPLKAILNIGKRGQEFVATLANAGVQVDETQIIAFATADDVARYMGDATADLTLWFNEKTPHL